MPRRAGRMRSSLLLCTSLPDTRKVNRAFPKACGNRELSPYQSPCGGQLPPRGKPWEEPAGAVPRRKPFASVCSSGPFSAVQGTGRHKKFYSIFFKKIADSKGRAFGKAFRDYSSFLNSASVMALGISRRRAAAASPLKCRPGTCARHWAAVTYPYTHQPDCMRRPVPAVR